MAKYTTEQLLSSLLSTEFYSAETIDSITDALSGEIGDIVDSISVDINPRLSSIADAVSAHVEDINELSAEVESLSGVTADISDLKAINAELSGITKLPVDGSAATIDIINKINDILDVYLGNNP